MLLDIRIADRRIDGGFFVQRRAARNRAFVDFFGGFVWTLGFVRIFPLPLGNRLKSALLRFEKTP